MINTRSISFAAFPKQCTVQKAFPFTEGILWTGRPSFFTGKHWICFLMLDYVYKHVNMTACMCLYIMS